MLRLNDPRRFGAVVYARGEDAPEARQAAGRLGVEPLADGFDAAGFPRRRCKRRKAPIKQVLLAGDVVVGVGNIYASEALFLAGIRPTLRGLAHQPAARGQAACAPCARCWPGRWPRAAARCAISPMRDGRAGYFQLEAMVYDRAGQPCRVCGDARQGDPPGPALDLFLPATARNPESVDVRRLFGLAMLYCKDTSGDSVGTSFNEQFDQHGAWRREFALRLKLLSEWLKDHELLDAAVEERLRRLETQMRSDKVMVAFVAEFSRGKSELINAIFFAGYRRRIMPASAGRTTMCPTELGYDADVPPCLRLLPIETRLQPQALMEWRGAPRSGRASTSTSTTPRSWRRRSRRWPRCAASPRTRPRALGFWHDDAPEDNPLLDADGLIEVPKWRHALINIAAPAAQAGPGDPGHARPQRDRRRARADRQPDPAGACRGLHPGRRHRRDQVRPGHLARAPDHRGRRHRLAPGGAQQDRHDVGLAEHARADPGADRPPARDLGRNPRPAASSR